MRGRNLKIVIGGIATATLFGCVTINTLFGFNDQAISQLSQLSLFIPAQLHYNPRGINDEFSQDVFKTYIERIDPDKRFLLKNDYVSLKKYDDKIDDLLRKSAPDLLDLSEKILIANIKDIREFYPSLLSKPFDFTENDTIELDPKKKTYCANKEALKSRWYQYLKYQTMGTYISMLEEHVPSKNISTLEIKKVDAKIEKNAREKVAQSVARLLDRKEKYIEESLVDSYFDIIFSTHDPHSNYFPPEEKDDFDISISGTLEGIGAVLKEDDSTIKIAEIIPGSAASHKKILQAGDRILKVAQGKNEPVDISEMRVRDAVKLIRGKKGSEVRLTIKKPDGRIIVVPIIREKVVIEDSYAKSVLLTHTKDGSKMGYIYLPSFYRNFQDPLARNSSDDIRAALINLKKQGATGLILDLRNNGGGALDDAVKISGEFFDQGPVVQEKSNEGKIRVSLDSDPETVFKGPLVVMVNRLSASASEIVAAALQDYGRAVIVGPSQSFGKGTVQTFIDLDQYLQSQFYKKTHIGSAKITVKKFYRITGGSTQEKGVVPDIILPDNLSYLDAGEKFLDHELKWDEIPSSPFLRWPTRYPIDEIKKRSHARINRNQIFTEIEAYNTRLKKQKADTEQSLNLSLFYQAQQKIRREGAEIDNHSKPSQSLTFQLIGDTKPKEGKDWLKDLSKDPYLQESAEILHDMISLKTK